MPLRDDVKKVLVIGSGPIVIGQAAEFDYAGTQACRALQEEGIEVVLINSNPATIMTDKHIADKIYIEPLCADVVKRIIEIEKPDSLIPHLGGQTGLNLAMELVDEGYLEKSGVKLLGVNPEAIKKAEDRQAFKDTMLEIDEPVISSKVINNVEDAVLFAESIGYPVAVRPAYTLGGSGGGMASDEASLREICTNGLRLSRVHQAIIEKWIAGWKEIEFEVIRDNKGNVVTVCSMENLDPVGVHTGDSIVVAPAQTLTEDEYNILKSAALKIICALNIHGGCNVQFALKPDSLDYAVIEVNPRVSRSSALASKATGYPIAKVTTKIAIGYNFDEIMNTAAGGIAERFELKIDYTVVKMPRWPFDKFVYADRTLGTQMMATGEVMAIDTCFEGAIMKAVRAVELGLSYLKMPLHDKLDDDEILKRISRVDDERIFIIAESLRRGIADIEYIHGITKIDYWFLDKIMNLINEEKELITCNLTKQGYIRAKKLGFLDSTIKELSGCEIPESKPQAVYKRVDTCAAEFEAYTPYYYSAWDTENEAKPYNGKKILVLGSGPIRIGQGIEFDYCSVHSVWALKECGYHAIIMNNNPETVSTDSDTSDTLYFEPLTDEDVENVIRTEKPDAVIVQFGGQTAIKLTKHLRELGVRILGTSPENIDAAEDRKKFDELLSACEIPRPQGATVFTTEDAVREASRLGYPVLIRPSYVLGGQNMIIAYSDKDVVEYMDIITRIKQENPILIDKYLMGKEVEVDAICDGEDILIPGIMEHLERAGIHSGDSISVYPPRTLSSRIKKIIISYTGQLAKALNIIGLVNIQFVVYNDEVYVIEVNPRSSRTVPYISKVTNVPMVDLATKCMLGYKLKDLGCGTDLHKESEYIAVKVPVFSFEKLHDVDTHLGPEMKSTGEVLGISKDFSEALYKGLMATGLKFKKKGGILISVRNEDKQEVIPIADKFLRLGFEIYATAGTANVLNRNMIAANVVRKLSEDSPNIMDLIESGIIDYVISTSAKGRQPQRDSVKLRRKAVERSIPCLTSLDTANALVKVLAMSKTIYDIDMVDINRI